MAGDCVSRWEKMKTMVSCRPIAFVCAVFLVAAPLGAQSALGVSGVAFAVIHDNPHPGEPVTVVMAAPPGEPVYASLVNGQNRRLSRARFFYYMTAGAESGQAVHAAVLAIPSTSGSGVMTVRLETERGVLAEREMVIADRHFNAEEIPLNQSNTDIRTKPDPEKTAQADELWAILSRTGNTVYHEGPFVPPVPVNTRRTSYFGDRRVYVYTTGGRDTSIHAGVDYGVPTGTPVRSCARGKVVLAKFRISTGYSVILEHLPGVYSLYYHMSALNVAEGSIIDTGTVLGQSGATGLATGPHLHWEIRVSTENTDPDALVNRAVLDKSLILSKIGLREVE
jgi:murein DD-endopeptidase MepM/ murein hydrolase activator NlpD